MLWLGWLGWCCGIAMLYYVLDSGIGRECVVIFCFFTIYNFALLNIPSHYLLWLLLNNVILILIVLSFGLLTT